MFGNSLIIHQVNPTGMFSYGLSGTINLLNRGLVHLVGVNDDKGGDSNGAGKSSLFNAICELLFQENPTGEKADAVINSVWGKGFAGRIMITNWQGIHYRITYCRKWKDKLYPADNDNHVEYVGTGLFLDKYEDKVWKDFRGAGMPETHQRILEVVGMTYNQFVSIAYMTHRVGSQFLRGTNKERIDILAGITGIEEWDLILEKCRGKKKILNSQITDLGQKVSFEQGSVQTLSAQHSKYKEFDWASYIRNLETDLVNAQIDHKATQSEIARINLEMQNLSLLRNASYNPEKVDEINSQIEILNRKLKDLEIELSRTSYVVEDPELEAHYQRITSELGQSQGELKAVRGKSGSILDMVECPTCGSKITKAKKDKIFKKIKSIESTILALEDARKEAKQALVEFIAKKRSEDEKLKLKVRAEIDQVRGEIQHRINDIQREQIVYASYEKKIQAMQVSVLRFQSEANAIKAREDDIASKIEQANASVKYIKTLEDEINLKKIEVKKLEEQTSEVERELEVYLWLIGNIPYIKLHKMSRAMVEISELCNKYFDEMGDSIRINISSFEEKISKKHAADVKDLMKSEVKVEIIDGSKNISPKLYSDGEISKVSLAVIRALHELARKSGQGCNLMLMDEVFSFVDGDNSQRIAHSLSGFLSKGTVFLTDNSGSVKNLINFDQVWVARKRNGQTLLEVNQ